MTMESIDVRLRGVAIDLPNGTTSAGQDRCDGHGHSDHSHAHSHGNGDGHGHSHDHNHGHSHKSKTVGDTVSFLSILSELRNVVLDGGTFRISALLILNLVSILLMFYWCSVTQSMALTAYSYLMWFHLLILLTCYLTHWIQTHSQAPLQSDSRVSLNAFSLGYARFEVLAIFGTTILTQLGAMFIGKESLERILEPPEIHTGRLMLGGIFGLISNLVLTYCCQNPALNHVILVSSSSWLQEHAADMSHSLCSLLPPLQPLLLPRVNPMFLIAITGFGSIVLTDVIIEINSAHIVDALFALTFALMTIGTMYPMCLYTGKILLQTTPTHVVPQLDRFLREALTIDGVLEFKDEHFWTLSFGKLAGSLTVRLRKDADEQLVLAHITDRLANLVSPLTIQVTRDDYNRIALQQTTLRLLGDRAQSLRTSNNIYRNPSAASSSVTIEQQQSPGLSPIGEPINHFISPHTATKEQYYTSTPKHLQQGLPQRPSTIGGAAGSYGINME